MTTKMVTFETSLSGDVNDSKCSQIDEAASELTESESKVSSESINLKRKENEFWIFQTQEEGVYLELPLAKETKDFKLYVDIPFNGQTCYFLVYCAISSKRLGPGSKFTGYSHPLGKGILFLHIVSIVSIHYF